MDASSLTSGKARAAICFCLLSITAAILAIVSRSDFFLIGMPVGWLLAVLFGILGLRDIAKSGGTMRGKAMAKWAIGLPIAGLGLGFCLLPAV